ncbi:MAG: DUF4143 domain-containing protein, partial [Bifidobacteriaceae bacterium]|nr:DUF4143 domain-containing protein [Bifidobacteriaceae bacterium]
MTGSTANRWPVQRNVEPLVWATLEDTPVTVIQGARQVGKSWLTQSVVERLGGTVYSLDNPTTLARVKADPFAFTTQPTTAVVAFDEAQRLPELMVAIKAAVDMDRRPGRFLVTGSADLLHVTGARESLAGRAGTVNLAGLSQGELRGVKDDLIGRMAQDRQWVLRPAEPLSRRDYADAIVGGGYPEALRRAGRRRSSWLGDYARAVTDHDARQIAGTQHPGRLLHLLRLIAANPAGEVVLARLGRDGGIPERSVPSYLAVLEDLYLVNHLEPFSRNLTKRATGRRKAWVADSALASHLAGLGAAALDSLDNAEAFGGFLEAFVVGELTKAQAWADVDYRLTHFRDSTGPEVDIVVELPGGQVIGIEVKATAHPTAKSFRNLEFLKDRLGDRFGQGVVLHTGTES